MVTKAAVVEGLAPQLLARANHLAELGTRDYPPKTKRRLKSINVGAFTIAVSCLLFAMTYALEDAALYRDAVLVNLGLMLVALSTPAFHRIHEIAAPIIVAIFFLAGLFVIVALVGRDSGIQINFIAASAAVFLIFDLRRLPLMVAIIAVAIALNIACWILFPEGLIASAGQERFLLRLYVTTVVTISIIIAVLVYYAFRSAEQAEAETETLLHLILPASIAERLKDRPGEPVADSFSEAAVLFSDLAGFVPIARSLGAERTVAMLNHLVSSFDRLAADHGVAKIKTIGDAYMAVAGVPKRSRGDAAAAGADGAQDAGGRRPDGGGVRRGAYAANWHRARARDGRRDRHRALQLRRLGRRGEPRGAARELGRARANPGLKWLPRCAHRPVRLYPPRRDRDQGGRAGGHVVSDRRVNGSIVTWYGGAARACGLGKAPHDYHQRY